MKSLKINDKVLVISGDHKGTEAKIVAIDRASRKAMLEGIKVVERHMKKTQFNPAGGKKTIHVGIDWSNLKLVEVAEYQKDKKDKKDQKDKKADKKSGRRFGKKSDKEKKGAK